MEKRNEKKIGKKRKNTPVSSPLDFYTVHKKLLLDLYNDTPPTINQESTINQEQINNQEPATSQEQIISQEPITKQEPVTSQESIMTNQEPKQDSIIKQEQQVINTNEEVEIIEYSAFEKWLYDMDILFLRNDKPFVEFKKYAYEMFISIFKY